MILRFIASILTAASLLCPSSFAFDTPLSDEAIREAYFLGQRHDQSLIQFLDRYTKHLPAPKTGPNIASISFLTPYAAFVALCSRHSGDYSAQQARLDHRAHQESVNIAVEIHLTNSYGQYLSPQEGAPSTKLTLRPRDFWKDFHVQVLAAGHVLTPSDFRGNPYSNCGRSGRCSLTGARLELEFPAETFSSDAVTVQVTPPIGDTVSVEFDPTSLR